MEKGDVLVSNDGKCKVIFERFDDDTYTSFVGKYYVECYGKIMSYKIMRKNIMVIPLITQKNPKKLLRPTSNHREAFGRKLNHETLEIENVHPEFKDGDIVVTDAVPSMCYSKCIFILKGDLNTGESRANSYVFSM